MPESQAFFFRLAAALGAMAVILGAFAAHGLKERIPPDMLTVFEVGVRYHMYHAIALLAVAAGAASLWESPRTAFACWAWIIGIVLFSGSLYLLALTGRRWLGAITPLGGVAFVVGWGVLALSALRSAGD